MFFQGINLSGLATSSVTPRGKLGFDYKVPSSSHYDYWFGEESGAETAMNIVRLPFRWERLQSELYDDLDQDYLQLIKDQVAYADEKGVNLILDVHNFGAFAKLNTDGSETYHLVGSEEVPAKAFEDLWQKLATEFKNDDHVFFGLMNEPTNVFSGPEWAEIAQGAINTIRDVGADNKILVPGVFWSSAVFWNTNGNSEALAGLTDPMNNMIFETHQYFDHEGSGFSHILVDNPVTRLYAVTEWARSTGNKLLLGEFGVTLGDASTAEENAELMEEVLQYMARNSDVWEGWTAWGAGEHWPDHYHFKLTPDSITGAEQDEALFLKALAEMNIATIEEKAAGGDMQGAIANGLNYSYEAERLATSGAYHAVATADASKGGAVLSYGGTGTVSLDFNGRSGYYKLKTDYFDESDGVSEFKISVNGVEIEIFVADLSLSPARVSDSLVSHLTDDIYLKKGDVISVSSARHAGELAAIDAFHLLRQDGDISELPTDTLWTESEKTITLSESFEAEWLTLSGAYHAVSTPDASQGGAALSFGGAGAVSLAFSGNSGFHQLQTDYFDEVDGASEFKISVNGIEVDNFVADQDLGDYLRTSKNLVSHTTSNIYIETGDVISVSSARDGGELAAIDALHLFGYQTEAGKANLTLTGLTDSHISDFDIYQNKDDSVSMAASSDGRGLVIDGNGWAAIDIDYNFTEHTIVSVNLTVEKLGEIHGVAFDTNYTMHNANIFQFAGTQNFGNNIKSDIDLGIGRDFTFHAGDYFTGQRSVMGFLSDDDNASNGLGHTIFDDIEIYELTDIVRAGDGNNIVTGTENAEYLYGGAGADIFNIDETHLGLADKIMDFDLSEGDKLDFSNLADDLGVNTDLILQNISLVTQSGGGGALLFNEGTVTGTGDNVSTLALFDTGIKGVDIADIINF